MNEAAHQGLHLVHYDSDVDLQTETMTERFNRLTKGMPESEIAFVMGISVPAVRKVKTGETKSMTLVNALRLCRRLNVSPWYLAGEVEPATLPDGVAVETEALGKSQASVVKAVRALTAEVARQGDRLQALESGRAKRSTPGRRAS